MSPICRRSRWCRQLFSVGVFIVSTTLYCRTLNAQIAATNPSETDVAEHIVRRSIEHNTTADLGGRRVDIDFIQKLLVQKAQNGLHGIRITNARFDRTLDLSNSDVANDIWLIGCVFADGADFTGTHFGKGLSLERSTFLAPNDKANMFFNSMRVGGDVNLRGAEFAGPVDFSDSEIDGRLVADYAVFKNAYTAVDFEDAKLSGSALFRATLFNGPLKMKYAHVNDLTLIEVKEIPKLLDLSQVVVQRELRIEGIALDWLVAKSLRVLGPTTLNPTSLAEGIVVLPSNLDGQGLVF